jgi:predicted RNase H-like HicB family nuclease
MRRQPAKKPYSALLEPDRNAGGYVVTLPDFGYGATQGDTEEEAMEMAQELLMLSIGDYMRDARALPLPRQSPQPKVSYRGSPHIASREG